MAIREERQVKGRAISRRITKHRGAKDAAEARLAARLCH
jgi:hypothetical protein